MIVERSPTYYITSITRHSSTSLTLRSAVDVSVLTTNVQLFDAHCCHMGTAIKHPVPDRGKASFVIFDIWALPDVQP